MKKVSTLLLSFLALGSAIAQSADSTAQKQDTIKVGNFVIIKKRNSEDEANKQRRNNDADVKVIINKPRYQQKQNIQTNWWIFDLGFANYRDETNYAAAATGGYLQQVGSSAPVTQSSFNLNTGKSSNVNIWVFMQKVNVVKHAINLKYGLGLEMYNYRYDTRLSYRKDPSPYVFNDTISFSKNKLYAGYVTVPVMLNVDFTPGKKNGLSMSAGLSAGYLLSARNKQISKERGKEKENSNFNLNPWRFAAIGELGLGPVRLYGSYSLNALHKDATRLEQYPYTIGVRFSNW